MGKRRLTHGVQHLIPADLHLEIIPRSLAPAPVTEICSTADLHVNLKHVVCLAVGRFGAEGTFPYLYVRIGDAEVGGLYPVVVAVVDDLVRCDVQGLIVFGDKDFGSFASE